MVTMLGGGGLSSPSAIYRKIIMIVLKKDNHYCNVDSRERAQALVNEGYEVQKNKLGGPKIVKEVKKKAKKKQS